MMKKKSQDKKRKGILHKFRKNISDVKKEKEFDIVPCLVVYNDTERLQIWLDAHPFFKKIVVIDQGSDDQPGELLIKEQEKTGRAIRFLSQFRFENFGEPDFNLLMKLTGEDACFITAPDEFISEKIFTEITSRVRKTFKEYGTRAFHIARKNFIDGVCVSNMFVTPDDADGKDWQLRISLGESIHFQNTPHTHAEATAE
ncbi:MAG: glycosyltransferase family 2 protein, partial [Nanoarchaeota archaeon]|nr:glycosyltransferase family 2 protein [Nanoarchaeota archaeon]